MICNGQHKDANKPEGGHGEKTNEMREKDDAEVLEVEGVEPTYVVTCGVVMCANEYIA